MNVIPRTILIVDDSPEDQELYRRYLLRDPDYSYTILEASLGQQGLELWRQHRPDAVLLDYRLPDLDGLEFLAQLPSPTPQPCLPVIVVTGQGNEAIAVQAIKAGAQDYLVKEQITPEGLYLAVNRAIATVRLHTQLQQRIDREHLVLQITQKIYQSLDLEGILQTTVDEVRQFLQTDRVLIFQLQPDGSGRVTNESVGSGWTALLSTSYHDACFNENYVEAFTQGLVTLKSDIHDGSIKPCHVELLTNLQVRANLVAPILQNGQLWGLLIAHHCAAPHQWQSLEVDLLKELATQAGIAIRQAELYQQAQDELAERKQGEVSLRRSEERYRTLFESMEDGFCVIEVILDAQQTPIDYRFLEANPAFEQQTGLTQAVGKTARQLLPNLEAHWFEIYGNVALTGESIRFEESSDAMNRWFDVYAFRIGQPEDRKVALLFKDISDRKQSEQALQESAARLSLVHKATRSGLWDWDMIQNRAQVSEEYCQLFGLNSTTQEVSYEQWINFLHPDDRAAATKVVSRTIQQQQDYYEIDYRILYPDGDRWIASKGQVFYNAAGDAVRMLGNVQDITDRKRLLQLEQAARAEAERANRVKDEFLAVLSHELRSPLNPILGWAKLLQTGKLDAAKTTTALATIERNARLQCQLIDDLLDIAKILRGKLNMNVAPVDLVFVIESAIETVKTAAAAKSIQLDSALAQIGQISGDSTRLQQIVWNLLSNAIKFTPNQGRVEIRLERIDNQAQITVSDTGKGISPGFLPHIFESFRQEDASTTRQYGGLGLGLAIVRSLVEAHGGTISADSLGEGQGATFAVQLPLLIAKTAHQLEELPRRELDLTNIKVLIVDDESDARELLVVILAQYGADVVAAASAAEGLTCLQSFQPDILVSDIGMPEMDGYTFLQQVRALPFEQGGQIPAIALTAYAREDDYQRAITHGYQRHMPKPLDPGQLVQAVVALTTPTV